MGYRRIKVSCLQFFLLLRKRESAYILHGILCVLSRFNTILVSRSFSQLKATFDEYSKVGVVILVMPYIMDYSAFPVVKFVIFADK